MLVFWKPRLVFLATPKTATTAIETALESLASVPILRPPPLKHTTLGQYHRYLRPYLEDAAGGPFTVVALIREPQDWLGSWYRVRQQSAVTSGPQSTKGMSFDDFVQTYCQEDPPEFADVGSQAMFLRPEDGKWLDRLFRYEEIDTFVHFLEETLNCEIMLPHLNVSPPGRLELSDKTKEKLQQFMADDIRMYRNLRPSLGAATGKANAVVA